jgi:hypothetical protein
VRFSESETLVAEVSVDEASRLAEEIGRSLSAR